MDMNTDYVVPTSLNVLAGIFLGIGALLMLIVTVDIVWRRGWKSMMLIMIPVFPINAAYMPLSVYVYYKYGRPTKPGAHDNTRTERTMDHGNHHHHHSSEMEKPSEEHGAARHDNHHMHNPAHDASTHEIKHDSPMSHDMHHEMHHATLPVQPEAAAHSAHQHKSAPADDIEAQKQRAMHAMHSMHGPSPDRPMWATVAMGVMHCGAGCVLGDVVGEWVVWASGATINGADVWPALLIDYAFALLFGIAFQYFSIAPMTGDYGLKTVWRAAKADFLSLTFFEVGLFGWMVAYQVGIWGYRLEMDTWVYWWMMQVGMFLGFWTAFPINWWLIKVQIKV